MAETPKIRIRELRKRFGPKLVLNGVDLDVADGESLVVIGGSGTGKSVLIKCILGILQPDSGSIQIDGAGGDPAVRGASARRSCRSSACCSRAPPCSTACRCGRTSRSACCRQEAWARDAARSRAIEMLGMVGLTADVADLSPAELSGGMQKRVGLARAIAAEPEILFFDEPTTGLDPIMADVINELIARLVRQLGATAISITHDLASARKIADRIAMIYKGRIIWQGPVGADRRQRQPLRRPVHPRPRRGPDRAGRPRGLIAPACSRLRPQVDDAPGLAERALDPAGLDHADLGRDADPRLDVVREVLGGGGAGRLVRRRPAWLPRSP